MDYVAIMEEEANQFELPMTDLEFNVSTMNRHTDVTERNLRNMFKVSKMLEFAYKKANNYFKQHDYENYNIWVKNYNYVLMSIYIKMKQNNQIP